MCDGLSCVGSKGICIWRGSRRWRAGLARRNIPEFPAWVPEMGIGDPGDGVPEHRVCAKMLGESFVFEHAISPSSAVSRKKRGGFFAQPMEKLRAQFVIDHRASSEGDDPRMIHIFEKLVAVCLHCGDHRSDTYPYTPDCSCFTRIPLSWRPRTTPIWTCKYCPVEKIPRYRVV